MAIIGPDAAVDPGLQAQIRARAIDLYRAGGNPTEAVRQALTEVAEPVVDDGFLGLGGGTSYQPRQAAPVATAGPAPGTVVDGFRFRGRSEEHPSELQSLMRISYAVFCLNKTTNNYTETNEAR